WGGRSAPARPGRPRWAAGVERGAGRRRGDARARAAAGRYGARRWYTNYRDLLADADVDAVINLTPIPLHAETTRAALAAGKHVYTEKPLASSLEEARGLRDQAGRQGRVLGCAPSVMLFPQRLYAPALLRAG